MKGIAYNLGGKVYDFLDESFEKTRYAKIRKKILPKIKGKILDAGCGTGRNFPYYSNSSKIIGVDLSEKMLKVAREKSRNSKNIKIKHMDLTKLKFPDNSFDAIVATFVLCTIPKDLEKSALKELVRVTKPNTKLYFLEYAYSKNPIRRFFMKAIYILPKLLYNVRFNSTLPLIEENKKLKIEKNIFVYGDVVRLIVAKKLKGGKND